MARRFGEGDSKYLRGSDLLDNNGNYREVNVSIERVTTEQFDGEDEKFAVHFVGKDKPMILNVTNERMLCNLFGDPTSPDPAAVTEQFRGKIVNLYFDPNVMFGGKRVGGLRLQEYDLNPISNTTEEPPPHNDADAPTHQAPDDVPF